MNSKKIALCFAVRDKPKNKKLWDPFINDERFNIYIHSSFEQNNEWNKYYIKQRIPTQWCNIMLALKTMLEEAGLNKENFKMVVLSESCIPITTPDKVYEALTLKDESALGYSSVIYQSEEEKAIFLHPIRRLDFIPLEHLHVNSAFFILNQEICDFIREDKEFIYKVTSKPCNEEQYIGPYLSLNNKLHLVARKNYHVIDWRKNKRTNRGDSPYHFGLLENEEDKILLKKQQENGMLFARKFNEGVNTDFLF